MKMIRAASVVDWMPEFGRCWKYNLLQGHDGLAKKIAKKSSVLNLELEEFRSKDN